MNKELIDLYLKTSKHSAYQILPDCLKNTIQYNVKQIINRYEKERMDFLKSCLSFKDKHVLDIGGNTGFFSFESIEAGAKMVSYVEGNPTHEIFVRKASEKLNKNIKTQNAYLDFKIAAEQTRFDIVLLFNVIHHLGDDFGDKSISLEKAKEEMQNAISYFTNNTEVLVLQMGFCWKGNPSLPLFTNGTKKEMIDFVLSSVGNNWEIQSIGIAEERDEITEYKILNEENIKRNDQLGEFRNRPIFILKNKSYVG